MALIDRQAALDALMAERKHLLDNGQMGAEHILTHCGYNVIDELPTVPAIPITYLNSRIAEFRAKDTYANQFAADFLQAIIKDYNKEIHNGKTE